MTRHAKQHEEKEHSPSHHKKMANHHSLEMAKHIDHLHKMAKGHHKQSAKSRLDESLGERHGKESTKRQSFASRRHESKGARK